MNVQKYEYGWDDLLLSPPQISGQIRHAPHNYLLKFLNIFFYTNTLVSLSIIPLWITDIMFTAPLRAPAPAHYTYDFRCSGFGMPPDSE